MLRFVTIALLVTGWSAAMVRSTFELRGEVVPHHVASVSLHDVASPFAVSTLAGPDGRFRFKRVRLGTYTLSVSTQLGGELQKTVEVSQASADTKGRINTEVNMESESNNRQITGTVSARAWQTPDRAQREYEEALKKIAKRDFEGAMLCLHRAVEIAPGFSAAWNHLGTMAYQSQQYREAEIYFRRSLEADPDAYEPLVNRGGVLLNLSNFEEALQCNNEAVRRRPNDALAQSQLGLTYALLNQLDSAEKHLLLAIRLDPDHFSHPRLSLAELYVREHRRQQAADQLEDFLRGHPDWPTAERMKQNITEWRSGTGQMNERHSEEQRK